MYASLDPGPVRNRGWLRRLVHVERSMITSSPSLQSSVVTLCGASVDSSLTTSGTNTDGLSGGTPPIACAPFLRRIDVDRSKEEEGIMESEMRI